MKVATIDVREQLNDERIRQGRTLKWLADTLDMNYNTLYSILVQRVINLTDETRDKINTLLGTDY